jgi:hypothetical protein
MMIGLSVMSALQSKKQLVGVRFRHHNMLPIRCCCCCCCCHHLMFKISLYCLFDLTVFVVLGILQLALPERITGAVTVGGTLVPCYEQRCGPDGCHDHEIECPSQGPFSMFQQSMMIDGFAYFP